MTERNTTQRLLFLEICSKSGAAEFNRRQDSPDGGAILLTAVDRRLQLTPALADCVIERHRCRLHGRARQVTIDLDPTDDPTHGTQQLCFFNGY